MEAVDFSLASCIKMTGETLVQGTALLEGFFLGIVAGIIYDLSRVLRARVKLPFLGTILDLLFWFLLTVVIFIWAQLAWGGYIRFYSLASLALGALFYFFTFTGITLWIAFRFADFTQLLVKLICLPITALILLEKKIKKNIKNLFLFWLKWYRIESMVKALDVDEEKEHS